MSADQKMAAGDDPADFTAPQVTAFLAELDDDAERSRVLDAERSGKARKSVLAAAEDASAAERPEPSVAERKGKRGHDDQGNVRPADGRFNLHDPKDESKYVRTTEES